MLATDGSDAARTAESWITDGAWQAQSLVDVVCVARRARPRWGSSLQTYRQPVRLAVDGLAEAQHLGAQSIANESGRRLQAAGFDVRTWARRGDPADELIAMARQEQPDLLVLGPRGRRGWAAVMLGSVSDDILAQVMVPVLLARPMAGRGPVPREVAVVVDTACMEAAALAWLQQTGWKDTARVTIVAVSHPSPAQPSDAGLARGSGDVGAVSDLVASHLAGTVVRYLGVGDASTEAIVDAVASLEVDVLVITRSRHRGCLIRAADIAINATMSTVIVPSDLDEAKSVPRSLMPDGPGR
jgi:nucleotide-binding universal stress UspA family protein